MCGAFGEAGLQVGSGFTAGDPAASGGVCERDKPTSSLALLCCPSSPSSHRTKTKPRLAVEYSHQHVRPRGAQLAGPGRVWKEQQGLLLGLWGLAPLH